MDVTKVSQTGTMLTRLGDFFCVCAVFFWFKSGSAELDCVWVVDLLDLLHFMMFYDQKDICKHS